MHTAIKKHFSGFFLLLCLLLAVQQVGKAQCSAVISSVPGPNRTTTFVATVSNTVGTATYSWNFGDGSTGNGLTAAHTYTADGIYVVTFIVVTGPPACSFTAFHTVFICTMQSGFVYTQGNNGLVTFSSTSTGTNINTAFTWNFGGLATSNGSVSTYVFPANGTYTVTLMAANLTTCVSTATQVITITTHSCLPKAGFTHLTGPNGLVNFFNATQGATSGTNYYWHFGDGIISNAASPVHTYQNAGTHYVMLAASSPTCTDTVRQAINITGITCRAISDFSLLPTPVSKIWKVAPTYPWNITNARWDWGDGNSSGILSASHTYSVPGFYSICLTVTVSCDSVSSSCVDAEEELLTISVANPAFSTGTHHLHKDLFRPIIYPNPGDGLFFMDLGDQLAEGSEVSVYTADGILLLKQEHVRATTPLLLDLRHISPGIYFVRIVARHTASIQKIVLTK